jgi:hypothetical protein
MRRLMLALQVLGWCLASAALAHLMFFHDRASTTGELLSLILGILLTRFAGGWRAKRV